MRINSNILATNIAKSFTEITVDIAKSSQALASGKRINSAADDAAGLQISTRLTSQISGLDRANKNIADGISYAQVADGALTEVNAVLQRMYQLAVQSANGSNTDDDRQALNNEFQQLKEEN